MRRSWYRIAGIYTLVISVFLILGWIFIPSDAVGGLLPSASLWIGVFLLIVGILLYKIVKVEE